MYKIDKATSWNNDFVNARADSRLELRQRSQGHYLKMSEEFSTRLELPQIYSAKERDDIFILDFAPTGAGLKAFAAEQFLSELKEDVVGYAAPRVGHAAESIARVCNLYGKRAVFFAPASQQVSAHQAVVTAYSNCELRFARVPAMPTLNSWIRAWALQHGYKALPFGLAKTPGVTAGIVKICDIYSMLYGEPTEFHCAVSTGTLIRGLEIGWPKAKGFGTAVARNMKEGETGDCDVVSYHRDFYKISDYIPSFDTTNYYDAKAYKRFIDNAKPGAVFINVGSDKNIDSLLDLCDDWQHIHSFREWGDKGAFDAA